ncbi:MAG TPA: protein kinase [Solirubrobacteraceae bacterium]|nr:protein kinase [Solirubrobacteraceae bacterium]
MSALLGTCLNGRYRLEARVGAGGMSTVYRAFDVTLERQVAVKLMNREVASDSDQLERFRREARAVAQLSHPHIVGVIDAGEDDHRPYIVLEYVEGETLKDRIRRQGGLPVPEAIAYAIQIARALGAAHARHIVHRDVKPQNVLIDREGSAKVTDFGIARTLEEEGLTADGRVLGTTDYVSPEQALGHPVTGRSDLYSLGIVLYEMLTGEVPFKGENQVAVAMKHVREDLPDVQRARPAVSAALASVVETATAKRQEDRYADDAELIADLEEVLAMESARAGGVSGQATSVLRTLPSRTQRRIPFRVRHPAAVLIVLMVIVIAVVGVLIALAGQAHHGNGTLAQAPPPTSHKLVAVNPCATCAHDYNPDAISGPKTQNPGTTGLAIDDNTSTAWTTQTYYYGLQSKPGVGLYVDVSPGVAARTMVINTVTPGIRVEIFGRRTPVNPDVFDVGPSGWVHVGGALSVKSGQAIRLTTGTTRYRYYLVWITSLGKWQAASLNEVTLYY